MTTAIRNSYSNEGSPTDPLLPSSSNQDSAGSETVVTATQPANADGSDRGAAPVVAAPPSALLLGGCTMTAVLVGLALIVFVAFLPLFVGAAVVNSTRFTTTTTSSSSSGHVPTSSVWQLLLMAALMNLLHIACLWKSPYYLAVFRLIFLPIRRLLLPLVLMLARIESIREQEPTLYYKVVQSNNNQGFRKSVRRHYRRMERIYQHHIIHHRPVRAEYNLTLSHVIPILWEHEKRVCHGAGKHPLEDFIQRALVVTIVPDGVLDLYYCCRENDEDEDNNIDEDDKLVGFQFSICQGNVWHWFMYFCQDEYSKAGIWWHGALLAIRRGEALCLDYVNAQMHQADSKQHAGYSPAKHTQGDVLAHVYPLAFSRTIPPEALGVRIWDRPIEEEG